MGAPEASPSGPPLEGRQSSECPCQRCPLLGVGLRENVLESSHHPAPYKAEGLRQRLLPFIQSPTAPGSPYQPTFPFSPILQRGTARLRGWGGVGGRHLPSKRWDRDLSISLGMPCAYPQESMLRREWGVALPSPPMPLGPTTPLLPAWGQASCRV